MVDVIHAATNRRLQKRKASTTALPRKKIERFLSVLAATCHVRRAAEAAGVTVSRMYVLRRKDAGFAAQWQDALTIGYDRLEAALISFALEGLDGLTIEPAEDVPLVVDPKVPVAGGKPGSQLMNKVSVTTAQFALALLNRHHGTITGRRAVKTGRRVTREETNAALMRKLDAIAKTSGIEG